MDKAERTEQISRSPFKGRYDEAVDRESAYEMLIERAKQSAAEEEALEKQELAEKPTKKRARSSNRQSTAEAFVKSAARSIGTQLGQRIIRGVLGSLFKR